MSGNDDGFDDFFDPYDGLNDLTGDEYIPPLEEPAAPYAAPPRSPLLTGLVVLLLLVVLTFAFFQLLSGDGGGDDVAATTTTSPDVVTTTTADDGSTTTTDGATTTTTAAPDFDPYAPRGEAIAIDDLKLQVDAIGPIELGSPARRAIGRLVASLGEPDEDTGPIVSTGAFGGCPGATVRIVRWGALAAVVVIDGDGTETFGGYRVDLNYDGALTHPTADLQTLSGLQPGASVREIGIIYENFVTRFVTDADLGDVFEVASANTGNLLLWGPVTSTENAGRVDGIYAPDACGRFQ